MEDRGLLAVSADQQMAVRISDRLKLRAEPWSVNGGCTECAEYRQCIDTSIHNNAWIPNRQCTGRYRNDGLGIRWVPA